MNGEASPADAIRSMKELTRAMKENTAMQFRVGQQIQVMNELLFQSLAAHGASAILKAAIAKAAGFFARSG